LKLLWIEIVQTIEIIKVGIGDYFYEDDYILVNKIIDFNIFKLSK